MRMLRAVVLLAVVLSGRLDAAIPSEWRGDAPAAVIRRDGRVALVNRKTAIVFDGKTFVPIALYHAGLPENRIAGGTPLWSARFLSAEDAAGPVEPVFRECVPARPSAVKLESGNLPDGAAFLRAVCTGSAVKGLKYTATITVTLAPDADMPRWKLRLDAGKPKVAALWSVDFPRLAFKFDPKRPPKMALPYRNGVLRDYPSDFAMPYPGAAVKFQMMSCYEPDTGAGAYLACEDDGGFSKSFRIKCTPKRGGALFSVTHYPIDRFNAVRFAPEYEVVCGARKGDWFDDAVRYRKWFVGSKYAAKGPMLTRKDVPQWLKEATLSAKLSTSYGRTLENNLLGMKSAAKMAGGRPILAIWYEYEQRKEYYEGMGRLRPLKPGVEDALRELKKDNIHTLAYVQSQIYDNVGSPEWEQAEKFMIRDFFGNLVPYHRVTVCRYTPWWQRRFCELGQFAVEHGFDGVYLDSFGKSSAECFRAEHGHGQGGGNFCIEGQRQLALQLREMLKARSPEFVMSGEAPVEAFVDLLDYYLLAVNSLSDGIPLWRAIAGDYMICHGRGMTPGPKKDSIIGETAELFLDGVIPGRVSFYGGGNFLELPEYAADKAFVNKVIAAIPPTLEYLRMGEMLRAPELLPAPASVTFHEYIKGKPVTRPGVLARVCRSHRDGSRCVVLVNIGTAPWRGKVKLSPDAGGGTLDMAVAPRDIVWKILR